MDHLFFPSDDNSKFRPEKGICNLQHFYADGFCRISLAQGNPGFTGIALG
jgi:hypothetical protein